MIILHLVLASLLDIFVTSQPEQPTSDKTLLQKLGLPGPPLSVQEHKINEINAFMMELFKSHESVIGSGLATSVASYPALQQKEVQIGENRWQFSFRISDVPKTERVVQAHMRIFKVKGWKQKETQYKVNIFHVTDKHGVRNKYYVSSPYNSSLAVRLLDTKTMESRQSHWCSFDIAEAVRVTQALGRNTIVFEITSTPENPLNKAPASRGIKFTKSRGKQPSIVIYADNGSRKDDRLVRTAAEYNSNTMQHDPTKTFCRRKDLFIDFSRLGWNWIIGPRGFDAYMCSGECPLSFSSKLKITNHALLQAFMGSKHKDIPMPCCSPTKLSPITLIYYTDNHGITMTEYQEMMVEQCGCE